MHISGQSMCDCEIVRVYFIDLDYPADFCFIPPRARPVRAGSRADGSSLNAPLGHSTPRRQPNCDLLADCDLSLAVGNVPLGTAKGSAGRCLGPAARI